MNQKIEKKKSLLPKFKLILYLHLQVMHNYVHWHCSMDYCVELSTAAGCTPLNTVPILFFVKAYSKNRHFRVFIMIKIGQTHVFLKDYVHIHQIGSHFVGGYRLDFSATGQEPRRSFCKLLALGIVLDCCRRNKIKSSQICQFLIKMLFFTEIC